MDVAMISHSISNILQWMKSPKPLSGIDIKQLENNLNQINEKLQTQSKAEWLQKVKDVVIELNDLMEDLRYKESTSSSIKSLIRSSGLNVKNRFKAPHDKKASEELIHLLKTWEKEGAVISNTNEKIKSEYQVFEKITMFGRGNEKKEIIDQLLKPNNSDTVPVVIAIFGVPGIGKTKLADIVCEDPKVKAHFGFEPILINDHQILNETFDVKSIAKPVTTTDNSKRVLLVIDDLSVEIEHGHLEKLQKKLKEAVDCTDIKMLVTTRTNHVANSIAAAGHVLKLQGLNQEESRSLFQHVNETNTAEPEPQIVKDCSGVPLWILIIAKLMKNRGGALQELTKEETEQFLQKLKFFFYDNLPTHQKLCFAYCSLFAQDYLIDAERLIQLWTAEGFLTIPSDKIPEQLGRACFDYFVPLVFHQVEEENKYRMNPLMHKLAKQVATDCDENIIVDSMGKTFHSRMLRALFDYPIDMLCGIPDSMFEKAKKLRTILLPYNSNNPRLPDEVRMTISTCDKIFNTFLSLRVLDMHDLGIKSIPGSIEEVKYLRYLDLSSNTIEKLPSCITNLIHLQTLKLSQCHLLKELPKDIEDLSCLNHLDIEGCLDLTHMPTGINKITSLQTLSLFVASKKQDMGGLRALIPLKNLRGHLEISHLEQVKLRPSKMGTRREGEGRQRCGVAWISCAT